MTDQRQPPTGEEISSTEAVSPEPSPMQPATPEPPPPPPPVAPVAQPTVSGGGDSGNRNLILLGFAVIIGLIGVLLAAQAGLIGGGSASPEPSAAASASAEASPSPSPSPEPSPSPSPNPPIASTLVLGGPPECAQRPFCAPGLKETYGIEFKELKALDAGGPLTVAALKSNDIQVGLLFTSDPNIAVNGWVLLEDDKQLQNADNVVPVARQPLLDASPGLAGLVNPFMDKLNQEALIDFNKRVGVDQEDPATVVGAWLAANGLQTGTSGAGVAVKIGSFNFAESSTLGELLAQILEANGYTVERKFNLGNREVVFPALQSGEIDLIAEYAATLLEFVNQGAGEASGDVAATVTALQARLSPLAMAALQWAPATDQNGFVVTAETASQYGLAKLSDLAKPAP
jgi:osmoprotectant transport system substrate-binding protein